MADIVSLNIKDFRPHMLRQLELDEYVFHGHATEVYGNAESTQFVISSAANEATDFVDGASDAQAYRKDTAFNWVDVNKVVVPATYGYGNKDITDWDLSLNNISAMEWYEDIATTVHGRINREKNAKFISQALQAGSFNKVINPFTNLNASTIKGAGFAPLTVGSELLKEVLAVLQNNNAVGTKQKSHVPVMNGNIKIVLPPRAGHLLTLDPNLSNIRVSRVKNADPETITTEYDWSGFDIIVSSALSTTAAQTITTGVVAEGALAEQPNSPDAALQNLVVGYAYKPSCIGAYNIQWKSYPHDDTFTSVKEDILFKSYWEKKAHRFLGQLGYGARQLQAGGIVKFVAKLK